MLQQEQVRTGRFFINMHLGKTIITVRIHGRVYILVSASICAHVYIHIHIVELNLDAAL